MTDEESLACRLKLLRKAKKLTQDELADKLKLTKSAISKFETGNSSPSFDTLKKVASLYNVSVDYLLNGQKGLDILFVDPFGAEAQKTSPYPAGQSNVQAYKLLSDIPLIELPHVSFKARASFNYTQLQRHMNSDIFDTVLHRLPPGKTAEDYKDAVVFDIEGDSMEPSLRDGQQVIAWPVPESKWEYLHNTACVVDYEDTVTVKAIYGNDLNNTDGLTLHATGGKGGHFTVSRNDIHSIWEVREYYGPVPFRLLP